MFLDYSLPRSSRYILFMDAPFRYSWRHLIQYFNSNIVRKQTGIELLTAKQKALHLALAFFEVLPILGIGVACIDWLIFSRKPRRVTDYSTRDIQAASLMLTKIAPVYCKIFGDDAQKQASLQEAYILPRYIEEMKELARKTGTHYKEVLVANTIVDRLSICGGSIKADNEATTKIATNYFHSQGRGHDVLDAYKSFRRYDTLAGASGNTKEALFKIALQETIASCFYDGKSQKLLYAFGSEYSANRTYRRYNLQPLLKKSHNASLAHNIDVPMGLLAPFTRLFAHPQTPKTHAFVSVGWLGLIGTYSGINEHGLFVAACSVPWQKQAQGRTPNHLLIRQILEEAKTIEEATKLIKNTTPSAPMNLIIATSSDIIRVELARK